MAVTRRFLPSMSSLCASKAAARYESFSAADAGPNLTQSAISRQIRSLGESRGSGLFSRARQTVRLTTAGEAYAREIRDAPTHISTAPLGFEANPKGGTLNLAILPTFGTRWLAPRLPAFLATNPGIASNLTTRLAPFDFEMDPLDAAIHFGAQEWRGAELEPVMSETVVPASGACLPDAERCREPANPRAIPLLHLAPRPDAWERWFRAKGVPIKGVRGMLVDHFATAAQAAASGLGVALLPKFLIEGELASGELLTIGDGELESTEGYYLAWPARRAKYPPLQAFRSWLREAAAQV